MLSDFRDQVQGGCFWWLVPEYRVPNQDRLRVQGLLLDACVFFWDAGFGGVELFRA